MLSDGNSSCRESGLYPLVPIRSPAHLFQPVSDAVGESMLSDGNSTCRESGLYALVAIGSTTRFSQPPPSMMAGRVLTLTRVTVRFAFAFAGAAPDAAVRERGRGAAGLDLDRDFGLDAGRDAAFEAGLADTDLGLVVDLEAEPLAFVVPWVLEGMTCVAFQGAQNFEIAAYRVVAGAKITAIVMANLGYACICEELRGRRPPVFTNRSCVRRTFDARGLPHVGALARANFDDLEKVLHWNEEHGIRFFRMSTSIVPWSSEYELRDLPTYDDIVRRLRSVGAFARAHGHRITSHPDHFTCLASPRPHVVDASLHALELQGEIFDLMGADRSPFNKINIHIGGTYGDKVATLARFEANFRRLSDAVKSRLTLENDDVPGQFTVDDLLAPAVRMDVPIVFDLHHQRFNRGAMTDREALEAAVATWPAGIRPVVHWSESQEGRKPLAHSDFVYGPLDLYGFDTSKVDVMIEAKCKERALLRYRDEISACAKTVQQ